MSHIESVFESKSKENAEAGKYLQQWQLWFDVGIKRYTTGLAGAASIATLWFDVGFKRYTTLLLIKLLD